MMPPVSIYDESSIFVVVRQMTFVLIFVLFWWDLKRGMFLAEKACYLSYIIIRVGLILEENNPLRHGEKLLRNLRVLVTPW